MNQPRGRSSAYGQGGGPAGPGRGLILIAFAVVLGVVLLGKALDSPNTSASGGSDTTEVTAPPPVTDPADTTTTSGDELIPSTIPNNTIRVLVVNGSLDAEGNRVGGVAGTLRDILQPLNYDAPAPTNVLPADRAFATTQVWYFDGFEDAAIQVATDLGLDPEAVVVPAELDPPVDPAQLTGVEVLVFVGNDRATPATTPAG